MTFNQFRLPYPNFDRSKVKDYAFKVIEIKDHKFIPTICENLKRILFGVVIDNSDTVNDLIKYKCLNQRVNFYPLDSIVTKISPSEIINKAKNIARSKGANVWHAKEVVTPITPDLQKLVDSLFGDFFICDNTEVAQMIAFDGQIKRKVITLEGDLIDPNGFVSGGKNNSRNPILEYFQNKSKFVKIQELGKVQAEYEKELDSISQNLMALKQKQDRYDDLQMKITEAKVQIKKIKTSNSGAQQKEDANKVISLRVELKELKNDLKLAREKHQQTQNDLDKAQSATEGGNRKTLAKKRESLTKQLGENKTKMNETSIKYNEYEGKLDILVSNIEKRLKGIKQVEDQIEEYTNTIENIKAANIKMESSIDQLNHDLEDKKYKKEKAMEALFSKQKEKKELIDAINSVSEDLEKNEKSREEIYNQKKDYEESLDKLRESLGDDTFEEISNQTTNIDPTEIKNRQKKLQEIDDRLNELRPKINKNAQNHHNVLTEKMTELNVKKDTITKDKDEFKLDTNSMESIKERKYRECFISVNENLTLIFEQMLPGATAKMVPITTPKGKMGIEIKIGFNGQWKESLSELSGGQRSLLALSMLLAMLKYRSAPFYIFDEIDSAMDLSHTENIGTIIGDNFQDSQFLVISLKKDMYKSANVLFKTKIVKGFSDVDRIQQRQARRNPTSQILRGI